jgi:hypothetical protein
MEYSFTINLTESELIALEAAIEHYRDVCVKAQSDGPKEPYFVHVLDMNEVTKKQQRDGSSPRHL